VYQALGACEADALLGIAKVHMAQGQSELAQKFLTDAIDVATETGTTEQVAAARNLLEKASQKKGKTGDMNASSLARTAFTLMYGDIVKAQFKAFESRAITLPGGVGKSSSKDGKLPMFAPPERHQVVYETRKQLVPTDPKTGMPL